MPDGLMHLGAMAVLVGAAYLNLDKISSTANALLKRMRRLGHKVREAISALEGTPVVAYQGSERIHPIFNTEHVYFLLYIANVQTQTDDQPGCFAHELSLYSPDMREKHRALSNKIARGLNYFSSGRHRRPINFLTILSIIGFFLLAWPLDGGWHKSFVEMPIVEVILYLIFCVTILWAFVSVYMAHGLDDLDIKCAQYLSVLGENLRVANAAVVERLQSKLDSVVGTVKPHTSTPSDDGAGVIEEDPRDEE
jgi:hypothetical protein